jgi:Na+/proline symporter
MLILSLYILFYVLVVWLGRKGFLTQIFKADGKQSWLVTGISLFMFFVTVEDGQLVYEILAKDGLMGMLPLYANIIGFFFVPMVLAPVWNKLQLGSDNQFILLRFSGNGARILYHFRAFYVGMLIVVVMLSFHVIGFARLLSIFFDLPKTDSLLITGGILLLFSLKNSFGLKLKTDFLHAIWYLAAMILLTYWIWQASGGPTQAVAGLTANRPDIMEFSTHMRYDWLLWLVFAGMHWWSVQLFDGGGPEMARYTAAKDGRGATMTGILNAGLVLSSSFILLLFLMMVFSLAPDTHDGTNFWSVVLGTVPQGGKMFIVLGFFAAFITSAESNLNWGTSFWSDTAYRFLKPKSNKETPPYFHFLCMGLISIASLMVAMYADSLNSVLRWFFALSAGVAPVFILRWFWMRINAWSQLSAMVAVPFINQLLDYTRWHEQLVISQTDLGLYAAKILILSHITMLVWLAVTFLTPPDDAETIARFREKIPSMKWFGPRIFLSLALGSLVFALWVLAIEFVLGWMGG